MAIFGKVKRIYSTPTFAPCYTFDLPETVKDLGRITGDDGATLSQLDGESDPVYDDAGDVALLADGEIEQTLEFTALDADTNIELAKVLYGADNVVKSDEDSTFSVQKKGHVRKPVKLIIDVLIDETTKQRIYFYGVAKQSDGQSLVYNEAVGTPVTVTAQPAETPDFYELDGKICGLVEGAYTSTVIIKKEASA